MERDSRRRFLGLCLGAVTTTLAAAALWPVWRYLAPGEESGKQEKTAIPRERVPVGGVHFFLLHGHPSVLIQHAPGEFLAFSAICTHLGCVIQWIADKGEFLCPCHGGRFSAQGKVLGGPPPRPLEPIPCTLAGDRILVG
jgi:cytochrome b6-f complex iron-sulfur subunit